MLMFSLLLAFFVIAFVIDVLLVLLLDLLTISVECFFGGVRTKSNDHFLLVILLGSITMTLVDIVWPNIATGSYSELVYFVPQVIGSFALLRSRDSSDDNRISNRVLLKF